MTRNSTRPDVVVLGCGIAGMLAAAAAAQVAETVTIIERDIMPAEATVRRGVPQGRHLHGLLSTGAHAIDALVPGALATLWANGAHRIGLNNQALIYGPHGWMQPFPTPHFIVGASRPLVEWTIHAHLTSLPKIRILEGVEVIDLIGDRHRVAGLHIRHRNSGEHETLRSSLIIDATGRTSKASRWLSDLGLPAVQTTVVDSGLAYASRIVKASPTSDRIPCVTIQPDPSDPAPGRGAFLLLIENNRWMVTLSGTRGARPPLDEAGFLRFAKTLRHPLIGELIADAPPLTRITGFGKTANRRHHYHRLSAWPAGFLVIGDAVASFNPIYGQGMSVAALSALKLRNSLQHNHFEAAACHRIQRSLSRTCTVPWLVSTTEDIRYPAARGPTPGPATHFIQHCADRLRAAAAADPTASRAFFDTASLSVSPIRLAKPATIWSTLRGPRQPPKHNPPTLDGTPKPAPHLARERGHSAHRPGT